MPYMDFSMIKSSLGSLLVWGRHAVGITQPPIGHDYQALEKASGATTGILVAWQYPYQPVDKPMLIIKTSTSDIFNACEKVRDDSSKHYSRQTVLLHGSI